MALCILGHFYLVLSLIRHRFLRNCESVKLKLGTHMDCGLMYCLYQNQGQLFELNPLIGFTILPVMKKNFTLFSRTVRVTPLKPSTNMDSELIYCVHQNQGKESITLGVEHPW